MPTAVGVSKLSYTYPGSEKKVLDGVDLDIQKGESYGLLGANGAGKTTLFSCICRQITNFSGEIKIFSKDIRKVDKEILKIGFAPQELALFPTLTGYENLDFFSSLAGLKGAELKERVEWALNFADLYEKRFQKVEEYSGGMKRRLNLAVAILNEPEVLILDEPTVGVDPRTRSHIFEKIEELRKSDMAIIYTSHYMEEVERLCKNVGILDNGKLLFNGSLESLKTQTGCDRLEQCYMSITGKEIESTEEAQ